MLRFLRPALIAAACSLMLAGSLPLRAEDVVREHGDATHAAPAQQPADAGGAAGCPHNPDGPCCGACQEQMKQGQPKAEAEMDCPCKRAKQAQQGS